MLILSERQQARQFRSRPWAERRPATRSSKSAATRAPKPRVDLDPASSIPRSRFTPGLKSCLKKADHHRSNTLRSEGLGVKCFGGESGVNRPRVPPSQTQVASRIPSPVSDLRGVSPRRCLPRREKTEPPKSGGHLVSWREPLITGETLVYNWDKLLHVCPHEHCVEKRGSMITCLLSIEVDDPTRTSFYEWAERQYQMGNGTIWEELLDSNYLVDHEKRYAVPSSDHTRHLVPKKEEEVDEDVSNDEGDTELLDEFDRLSLEDEIF